MDAILIKLNGWPDSYNERVEALSNELDTLSIVKPKNSDSSTEPNYVANGNCINIWPSRDPVLNPRWKIAFYPIWMIQAVFLVLIYILWNDIDVIHVIDYPFAALVGRFVGFASGRPIILSIRSTGGLVTPDEAETSIVRILLFPIFRRINMFSIQGFNQYVSKSPHQVEYLSTEFGMDASKVTAIPTGVDFDLFDPSNEHTTPSFLTDKLDNCSTVLVFLGSLLPEKGAHYLINNMGETAMNDVGAAIIGDYRDAQYVDDLEVQLSNHSLEEKIVLKPNRVPFADVPSIIQFADGICLFSRDGIEGVPRILQESVAMETPVIATNVRGIKEIFTNHDGCFLIEPDDTEAFESAVRSVHNKDPDRENFREIIDMHENYRKYIDVYKSAQKS